MVGKKIDLPFFGQSGLVSRTILPELSPCYTLGCGGRGFTLGSRNKCTRSAPKPDHGSHFPKSRSSRNYRGVD